MLALYCCFQRCPDVQKVAVYSRFTHTKHIPYEGPIYPHTCVWNCKQHDNKNTRRCYSVEQTTDEQGDRFQKYFERLPHEMKIHCLSYCGFHVLTNTELWLQDSDRLHYKHVMRDHHITQTHCPASDRHMYDLNRDRSCVYVDVPNTWYRTTNTPDESKLLLDKRFGSVNRYPASYYRRCSHFANDTVKEELTKAEVAARWRRFHGFTSSSRAIDKEVEAMFKGAWNRPNLWYYYTMGIEVMHKVPPVFRHDITLDLEPGLYYWEFINYNWEEELSAIEEGRQRHFFLDPTDSSHTMQAVAGRKKKILMSLMYRRVCHPEAEKDDRYTNITYFQPTEHRNEDRFTSVYFAFHNASIADDMPAGGPCNCKRSNNTSRGPWKPPITTDDPDEDSSSSSNEDFQYLYSQNTTYHRLIYQHVLTPYFYVHVYDHRIEPNGGGEVCKRCGNRSRSSTSKEISYYCARIPSNATLYSLDRNRNTIRLNFFMDLDKMGFFNKSIYGDSIVKAVNSSVDLGYAFVPDKGMYSTGMSGTQETGDIVDFFFG